MSNEKSKSKFESIVSEPSTSTSSLIYKRVSEKCVLFCKRPFRALYPLFFKVSRGMEGRSCQNNLRWRIGISGGLHLIPSILGWANLWSTGCYANSSAGQLSWYGQSPSSGSFPSDLTLDNL
ncbi:Uncharacterized protein Fot_24289 [Forsythia ovata]|uniref:Uncharacterized protein n=1 Tax=Forsythia ovata TaxID=205694 RepID=A0ABD1U5T0_9LAMI